MWTRQWVEHKYGGEIWTEENEGSMDGIPIHGPSFMIAISIYFHVTCQGRSGWVQKLRQRRLFTLKTATCHLCARESFAWRLAWLQAKTGFKVNLKAADHVTFLRARNSPRAEQSKKIIRSLLRLLHHHYKNLPVSLLPSSNDQLWAHYR